MYTINITYTLKSVINVLVTQNYKLIAIQ